ncbi:MAG: translation initiation factor [Nitrospirae bacterium]|nr:translation initiation factor [Nitrospirota bacterium]MDE3041961.1 translation initiation factor [Nitrospirota bacterium]MDE3218093.1 translation initiation factor [Nitrospirota bacterium]
MKEKKRIPTSGDPIVWTSPFAALKDVDLPPVSAKPPAADQADSAPPASKKNRGRVDIIRQTAHRGGKTVTVVTGFPGISLAEKETLAKEMQKTCGAGGTVKEGRIEIQGDQREAVARILTYAGFRPVFAGG